MEKKIDRVTENVEKLESVIDPPEKDLMARDVLQMMMKLVVTLVVIIVLVIGAFIGYSIYKDKQYNDFINSFEFETVDINADQDGQGTNIVNNGELGDVPNGEN